MVIVVLLVCCSKVRIGQSLSHQLRLSRWTASSRSPLPLSDSCTLAGFVVGRTSAHSGLDGLARVETASHCNSLASGSSRGKDPCHPSVVIHWNIEADFAIPWPDPGS